MSLQDKNEWEKIWEKFVLHDAVLDVFASPEVGDKFEPEKYNYANQKLNALTGYIYTRGKNVIQEILSTREKEIAEEIEKMALDQVGDSEATRKQILSILKH